MGMVLACVDRYEEALGAFDKAITLAPSLPLPWSYKVGVLTRLGRHSEATEAEAQLARLGGIGNAASLGTEDIEFG
jgi:Flp pilus assembly protein TadD